MTLIDAIKEADRLKPNAFPTEDKLRWLERLERRVRDEILLRCEGRAGETGELSPDDLNAQLQVPSPYDEMYIHWLCAQVAYFEEEYEAFNAANALFEAVYGRFRNAWYREHRPLTGKKSCF